MSNQQESELFIRAVDDTFVIGLSGDWDAAKGHHVSDALECTGDGRDVVVDLRNATFLDSSVLAELVRLHGRLHERDRRLAVLVGSNEVRTFFRDAGIDRTYAMPPSRNVRVPQPV